MDWLGKVLAFIAGTALTAGVAPGGLARAEEVDVALVLADDVSGSMTAAELQDQRDGLASAFRDPALLRVIRAGPLGRIAVSYVEWAAPSQQWIVAPWFVVATAQDASALAERITKAPQRSGTDTSISQALLFASRQFDKGGLAADRKVIDISGNGRNNDGPPVKVARDLTAAQGITINGLPMAQAQGAGPFDYLIHLHKYDIGQYYEDCVVGGVGAFTMPVTSPEQFSVAIRRKLALEIAARSLPAMPAGFTVGAGDDAECGAGSGNG